MLVKTAFVSAEFPRERVRQMQDLADTETDLLDLSVDLEAHC
jgi:hypothetical protein